MSPCPADNNGCQIFLSIVAPLVGNILAFGLTIAPARGVWKVFKGEAQMDPMFSISMVPMALTSLAYGFVLRDWWLAAPNLTSFPLGILYSLILLRSLPPKKSLNFAVLLTILSFISAFWSAVALIHLGQGTAMASLIQGIGVTLAIGFMYIAPLSTLLLVLRTRSAESIYIPVSIATLFNSLFWMGYGVFIGSGFIWGPNCVGAVSAGLQILLKLMFRGKRVEELVVGEAELGEAGKESKDDVADKDANV